MIHARKTLRSFLTTSFVSAAALTCALAQAQLFPGQDGADVEGQQTTDAPPTQIPQTEGDQSTPNEAPPTFFPSEQTLFPGTQDDFNASQQADLQQQLNAFENMQGELNAFQLDALRQQMLDLNVYWDDGHNGALRSRQVPLVSPQMDFEYYSSRYPGGYYGYPIWHPRHPNFNSLNQPNFDNNQDFDNQQPNFTDQQRDFFNPNPNSEDGAR
jgi:hypothetical protein